MNAIALPILIPLVAAAVAVVARRRVAQEAIVVAATFVLLAAAGWLVREVITEGILVSHVGGWKAPFGITLVADRLSAAMVAVTAVIGACTAVYAVATVDLERRAVGFFPLFAALLAGVCGAFLTGDLFNLYVWFEVLLIASFVLLALGRDPAQIEGAVKYVTMNLLSSAFFLAGAGVLYGEVGTLNMADLSLVLREGGNAVTTASAVLLGLAFGIKAAVFPLFFWLPDSYHRPPIAVSAVFAGLLTKVGVYALIRIFTLVFPTAGTAASIVILVVAGATMVTGVLGAAAQWDVRRVLSFHIISQVGYMVMGLGLASVAGIGASIFYVLHHILVKTNLFLIAGLVRHEGGSFELKELGGLVRRPALAMLFLVPALSLSGVPPLSGFFAKLALVEAGIATRSYWIVGVSLAVGLLTLFSMTKVWNEAFWKPAPGGEAAPSARAPALAWIPAIVLAAMTVGIGLAPEPLLAYSHEAAKELVDPAAYVEAVLGRRP